VYGGKVAATLAETAFEVRDLAARGEFASARELLVQLDAAVSANESSQSRAVAEQLPGLSRTLEVLESIEVVRNLMRAGNQAAAAEASARILDRLSDDDYAELGISAAAVTLLSRAGELARRQDGPEIDAFVEYLGSEVSELQQRRFEEPFKRVLGERSRDVASTLGDLLERKPWRSGMQAAVKPEAAQTRTESAHVPTIDKPGQQGGAPVLGKILIEQEPRASAMPETQTSGASGDADVFDVLGRSALQFWYVVLGTALVFSLVGYLIAIASPPKYQATAILQKSQSSQMRAPISGQATNLAPALPREAVAEMTRMQSFYQAIEKSLTANGWSPADGPLKGQRQPIMAVSMDEVAGALKVIVKDTGGGSYLVEFTATHADENTSRAIADTAARVFKQKYHDTLVAEPEANLKDYKARSALMKKELEDIAAERMKEFYVASDSEAVGLTTGERIRQLVDKLGRARSALDDARHAVEAGKLELLEFQAQLADTEPTIPNPQHSSGNPQLDALYKKWQETTDELLELDRKRGEFGPKHPIHTHIADLRAQRAQLMVEIEKIEEETGARRNTIPNPAYSTVALRVKEAKARLDESELSVKRWTEESARIEIELNGLRDSYIASEGLRVREAEVMEQQKHNGVVQADLEAVIAAADRDLQEVQFALRASAVEPKILIGIAVGLVLGLVVGMVIAIALLRRRKLAEVA
jgi:hypothetical protein